MLKMVCNIELDIQQINRISDCFAPDIRQYFGYWKFSRICRISAIFRISSPFLVFMKWNSPFPKKFADFPATLDNFLLLISSPIECDVFQLYQELNAVQSEKSKLNSRNIACFASVLDKIILYLCKMIIDLKNLNAKKVHIS